MRPAYGEYFRTETIEEKQARLRCLLLRIDFVIPAGLHTFLGGVLDPLQWIIGKVRVSQRKGYEQIDDVNLRAMAYIS